MRVRKQQRDFKMASPGRVKAMDGLCLIQLMIHSDERGFFTERYSRSEFKANGIPNQFVQDNHSRSAPGVLRGLHFQHGQGKLVGCTRGRIFDVVVDLRKDSATLGKWYGEELSDRNGRLLWVPSGFAHGFCVLGSESADVVYKVDAPYNPKKESGIAWDDAELRVDWPVHRVISDRDRKLQSFREYRHSQGVGCFTKK